MLLFIFYCIQLSMLFYISSQSALTYHCSTLLEFSGSFHIENPSVISDFCATAGFPYSKTIHWEENYDNEKNCCEWDGVTCDNTFKYVIEVDLSCSGLVGSLHSNSSLFHFSHLEKLNLAFNDFNGSQIPSKLGQISSLTHLNLSNSNLGGSVPSEISYLSKLKSLDLSSNNTISMQGDIWKRIIENQPDISDLILSGVNFSSVPLPSIFMNLTSSLTTLDFSNCKLTGNYLSIAHLPKLQKLDLSGNFYLEASLANVMNMIDSSISLEILDLSRCQLHGEIPTSLTKFNQLTHIHLTHNRFHGPIPSSLGTLTKLSVMDLSYNHFTGSIPPSVGNLTKLSLMDFSVNNLSSPFPTYLFSNLPNLEYLSLSQNHFSGSLPTQMRQHQYHKLRDLNLSHNYLSGSVPVWCFTLPSIEHLDLSFNQFDYIPEFSPYSPSLYDLRLHYNSLQGSIPNSIFNLVGLSILDISVNNLSGFSDLNMFSKLTNLAQVNISHNIFLSFSARNIGMEIDFHETPSKLRYVDFSYCNISDFPIFLKQAQNLVSIDLSNNNIHGDVPKWFQDVGKDSLKTLLLSRNYLTRIELLQWSNLGYIDLSSNSLQGKIPILPRTMDIFLASYNMLTGGISHSICKLSYLEILDLSHNNLSGTLPQCLGHIAAASLCVFDLQANNFHGTIPETLMTDAIHLKTLKLGGNKLKGMLPRSLASCKELEILDVGHNQIEDWFPKWLEGLPNLQVLILGDNKFHGFIASPQTEHPFPHLRILDLSDNSFSGPLPAAYITHFKAMVDVSMSGHGRQYMDQNDFVTSRYQDPILLTMKGFGIQLQRILTIFTIMDFSNNYFEGEIPQVIGDLKSLIGLNLSHNMLNGSIPPSFAKLSNLEWLDLSSNKFKGKIPSNMTLLTFLLAFNVSCNQLTGRIPEGKQFDTFTSNSYIGNDGLCGKPLSQECSTRYEGQSPSYTSDRDDDDEMEFGWKPVMLGCACGFLFGVSIAYFILSTGQPWWLVKMLLKSSKLKRLYLLIQ